MGPSLNIFVTGTGSGVGCALAAHLVRLGHTVYGGVVSADEGARLSYSMGARFLPLVIDVRSEESMKQAAQRLEAHLGEAPLHALANVAGISTNGPLADLDGRTFQDVLAVNVVGVHNVTRALLPYLRRSGCSNVVNMSSASGRRTMPFTAAYSASKFALEALSTAMRLEFSPFGISVSVVAPSMIKTPMAEKIQDDLRKRPGNAEYTLPMERFLAGAVKATTHGIPMERVVTVLTTALTSPKPAIRYELHNNFFQDVILMRLLPTKVRDTIVKRVLGLTAPAP